MEYTPPSRPPTKLLVIVTQADPARLTQYIGRKQAGAWEVSPELLGHLTPEQIDACRNDNPGR